MGQKHYSEREAQGVVGGGGPFCVCYCDEEGREISSVLTVFGVTYVPHQGCFLVCREFWLPLASTLQIQPYHPAPN